MKKRFLSLALILCLLLGVGLLRVQAAEVQYSGECGDSLTWTLTDDKVLTISGTGPMWDYDSTTPKWYGKGAKTHHH